MTDVAGTRRLLVLGESGQVARALARRAPAAGWTASCIGRGQVDLATAAIEPLIEAFRPALVVNAAAYTAVDRAEGDREAAFALNAELPRRVARACTATRTALVHISTDYVFDGTKGEPYREDDPLAPLGVYGASKAAGEQAVRVEAPDAAIVRTSWVFSADGANFLRTMLRLARARDEVRVVADQRGSPTWAEDVAESCLRLGVELCGGDASASGVFHAAGAGETTWAGFAEAIFAESARAGGPCARVAPIPSSEYPTPAKRPGNSRLDCGRLERVTGWRPRDWRAATSEVVAQLAQLGFPD